MQSIVGLGIELLLAVVISLHTKHLEHLNCKHARDKRLMEGRRAGPGHLRRVPHSSEAGLALSSNHVYKAQLPPPWNVFIE